jgi:hypothetical protein
MAGVDGVAAEDTLDEWAQRRRRAVLEDVQRISHRRATEHATADDQELTGIHERYAAVAADPQAAYVFLRQSSMIASVRRQRENGARF